MRAQLRNRIAEDRRSGGVHFLAQQALTDEEVNRPLWIDSASWARDFRGVTTRVHQKYEVDGRVRRPSGEIVS